MPIIKTRLVRLKLKYKKKFIILNFELELI